MRVRFRSASRSIVIWESSKHSTLQVIGLVNDRFWRAPDFCTFRLAITSGLFNDPMAWNVTKWAKRLMSRCIRTYSILTIPSPSSLSYYRLGWCLTQMSSMAVQACLFFTFWYESKPFSWKSTLPTMCSPRRRWKSWWSLSHRTKTRSRTSNYFGWRSSVAIKCT